MHMNEEDTFWTMISILNSFDHDKYILQGMPKLWESFYVLMKLMNQKCHKLFEHFV